MSVLEPEQRPFNEFIEKMEGFARGLGLYLVTANGADLSDDEDRPGIDPVVRPVVAATFMLGEEAFSDRVQHPERYSDEVTLAQIEHATQISEADRILQRYQETGKVFEEEDDDVWD